MTLSPEQFEELLKALNTPDGSQYSILVFAGIIALAGIMLVVWFVLNMRLKPVDKLEARMDEMQKMLTNMNGKMWTAENLDNRINNKIHECIKDHERDCPVRQSMLHKG